MPHSIIEDFWAALRRSPIIMIGLHGQHAHSEPMSVYFDPISMALDRLFMFTHSDNRLVHGIAAMNAAATATFASKRHDFFASLVGQLDLVDDAQTIDHFWSDEVAAYYEEGREDPTLTLLAFQVEDAELWKADRSLSGRMRLMFGGKIGRSGTHAEHVQVSL